MGKFVKYMYVENHYNGSISTGQGLVRMLLDLCVHVTFVRKL